MISLDQILQTPKAETLKTLASPTFSTLTQKNEKILSHSAGAVYGIFHFIRRFEVSVQIFNPMRKGSVIIGVNRDDLVVRKVTKEELRQSFQGGGYEKLATIFLAMASN